MADADPTLQLSLQYQQSAFGREAVQAIADRLERVLRVLVTGPDTLAAALDVLSEAERDHLLAGPASAPEEAGTVPDLIAEWVARTPDAVAVVHAGSELTFADLDRRSGRVAAALQAAGLGRGSLVAVALPRTADLVTVLLGFCVRGRPTCRSMCGTRPGA
jgi:non-ribosomal peptide synthetase component F